MTTDTKFQRIGRFHEGVEATSENDADEEHDKSTNRDTQQPPTTWFTPQF
jgi:hypothetical protein